MLSSVSTPEQAKKISLEMQEKEGFAYCEEHGILVTDVIRIPGYSRRFFTLRELSESAMHKNHDGPARLEQHLLARDFDVLIVRSTNRFAREQAINAEIISKVVKWCKGRIIPYWDGVPIDKSNFRMMIAMTGLKDSVEVDELVKKRQVGIVPLAQRGVPSSGRYPLSHYGLRDPGSGNLLRTEVRRDLLPMWRDLARLVLDNVPYDYLEDEMFTRFGYGQNGKPYRPSVFQRLIRNPVFWGHQAIRWRGRAASHRSIGAWCFDPSVPPPEGVDMFYNTHEPAISGPLADQLKAELRRRTEVFNGVAQKSGVKMFTGLVICGLCRWRMVYQTQTNAQRRHYTYLRCNKSQRQREGADIDRCENRLTIPEQHIQEWLTPHLKQWIETDLVSFEQPRNDDMREEDAARLRLTVATLDRRVKGLVRELADSDDDLKTEFRQQLRSAKDELNRVTAQLEELERASYRQQQTVDSQHQTLADIQRLTLEGFWKQDSLSINQQLNRLLGPIRLVGLERQIVGFVDVSQL